MRQIKIFFLRLLLSIGFAYLLSFFSDEKKITSLVIYVILLLGLSYFADYIRKRNRDSE